MTLHHTDDEQVWKALADGRRRLIIDELATADRTTGELVRLLPDLGRTGVLRHISILEEAALITVRREGRNRWNSLNLVVLQETCGRWVASHAKRVLTSAQKFQKIINEQ